MVYCRPLPMSSIKNTTINREDLCVFYLGISIKTTQYSPTAFNKSANVLLFLLAAGTLCEIEELHLCRNVYAVTTCGKVEACKQNVWPSWTIHQVRLISSLLFQ